jgi:outer membrane biosynthesis protein TonB
VPGHWIANRGQLVEVKILTSTGRPVLDREARATDRDNWRINRGRGA